jgi:Xaa-Pro dipeptidase
MPTRCGGGPEVDNTLENDVHPLIADIAVDEGQRRAYCLARTRDQLRAHDMAAALLFDPPNVRYTTAAGPCTVFMLHNPDRFVLVPVESEPVLWEFESAMHLTPAWNGDIRPAPMWRAFGCGTLSPVYARAFADEVARELASRDLLEERIGVDRLDAAGFQALLDRGIRIGDGQLPLELARAIKGPDEIIALRASARVCDEGITVLREALRPGATENEIWAAFNGKAFSLGAEYNETRLLVSGPRTNPWFQEATMRVVQDGELVAFDTDLVGPRGYLTDISRTYLCGTAAPTKSQRRLYGIAYEYLQDALTYFRPGIAFSELESVLVPKIPSEYQARHYPNLAHGSGLADEYPAILFAGTHPGELEVGMSISVEIYIGGREDREGVKLEEQILITADGYELLSKAPYEDRLIA